MEPQDYRIYYVNIDLCHQYGISVAESQTFLRAKRPQRRRARRNGCFRRLLTTLPLGRLSLKHFPVSARCLFLADKACQKVGDIHHLVFLACSCEFLRFGFIQKFGYFVLGLSCTLSTLFRNCFSSLMHKQRGYHVAAWKRGFYLISAQ